MFNVNHFNVSGRIGKKICQLSKRLKICLNIGWIIRNIFTFCFLDISGENSKKSNLKNGLFQWLIPINILDALWSKNDTFFSRLRWTLFFCFLYNYHKFTMLSAVTKLALKHDYLSLSVIIQKLFVNLLKYKQILE